MMVWSSVILYTNHPDDEVHERSTIIMSLICVTANHFVCCHVVCGVTLTVCEHSEGER